MAAEQLLDKRAGKSDAKRVINLLHSGHRHERVSPPHPCARTLPLQFCQQGKSGAFLESCDNHGRGPGQRAGSRALKDVAAFVSYLAYSDSDYMTVPASLIDADSFIVELA